MGKEKTQFKKGNQGRPKGATNKSITRSRIVSILSKPEHWQRFETELLSLKGRAFVENFIKLFDFDTPKYQAINFSLSNMSEQDLEFLISHIKQQMTGNDESGFDS
jgi:hypothetical protein